MEVMASELYPVDSKTVLMGILGKRSGELNQKTFKSLPILRLGTVTYACNSSYWRGRDQDDCSSRPA
jgi:hypothetical protein